MSTTPPPEAPASPASSWDEFGRSQIARTGLRAAVTTLLLLLLYFHVPIATRPHEEVAVRLAVSLALFAAVLMFEVRSIANHRQPMLRAAVALALVIPLFLVLFAWIYLTMSLSDPHAFALTLTRPQSLYFTVTIFSTVGFGDITPKTEAAQMVVTVQMLCDLAFLALVVRVVFGAATRGLESRKQDALEQAE